MTPFERTMIFILGHEGGLSDDAEDKGGLTKFGISQKSYPDVDIRKLTQADALDIYRRDFWARCQCDHLPEPIAVIVMDCAVNQGASTAIRLLQKSLGVNADGVVGSQTIAAVQRAFGDKAGQYKLVTELVARRMFQYGSHPQFARYGLGWSRRLSACHYLATEKQ